MAFSDDIRRRFASGDALVRLIVINLGIFLLVAIPSVLAKLFKVGRPIEDAFNLVLAMPVPWRGLALHPWTPLTYMFYHTGLFHVLGNMLWLYWFGQIFKEFLGEKRLVVLYILGGLVGGLLAVAALNLFPLYDPPVGHVLGASGAVMAIVVGAATVVPTYSISLFGIFTVQLRWIALVAVLIDFVQLTGNNPGGHWAHLGGAMFGYLYVALLRKGTNVGGWLEVTLENLASMFGPSRKLKVSHRRPSPAPAPTGGSAPRNPFAPSPTPASAATVTQAEVDRILEKISRSGYDSLSSKERQALAAASRG